jgi:hypothetical protein
MNYVAFLTVWCKFELLCIHVFLSFTLLPSGYTVQGGYLGSQMRDEQEEGLEQKEVSVQVWWETFTLL